MTLGDAILYDPSNKALFYMTLGGAILYDPSNKFYMTLGGAILYDPSNKALFYMTSGGAILYDPSNKALFYMTSTLYQDSLFNPCQSIIWANHYYFITHSHNTVPHPPTIILHACI